ncbi:hypothetical protein PDE_07948 [Penicillium oxalicum 114-2]|uniref:Uncharacterized protein n=1 Tax=Penicillium oxalicum (strain 114-2 / CGMCC 5302) TaxID=933388 RepID=S8BDC9_PENO1|nr:hypothetical protein PDE_07948 [Penicillium oxalicum 114-2]
MTTASLETPSRRIFVLVEVHLGTAPQPEESQSAPMGTAEVEALFSPRIGSPVGRLVKWEHSGRDQDGLDFKDSS